MHTPSKDAPMNKSGTHGIIIVDDHYDMLDSKDPSPAIDAMRVLRDEARTWDHTIAVELVDLPDPADKADINQLLDSIDALLARWQALKHFRGVRILVDNMLEVAMGGTKEVARQVRDRIQLHLGSSNLDVAIGLLTIAAPKGEGQYGVANVWQKHVLDAEFEAHGRLPRSLELFLGRGDLIDWFVSPPGVDAEPRLQWFDDDTVPSHNPCEGYFEKHIQEVERKLCHGDQYEWREGDRQTGRAKAAKALVHSDRHRASALAPGDTYWMPAKNLRAIMGERLRIEGDLYGTMITLPVLPALPFLVAVKEFFTKLESESNGADNEWSLSWADKRSKSLQLVSTTPLDPSSLIGDLEAGRTTGHLVPMLRNAIGARCDRSYDSTRYALADVLAGPQGGVAGVGLVWSASPPVVGVKWDSLV
jgi:hypothetical protein